MMALDPGKYLKPAKMPIIPIVLLAILSVVAILPTTPLIITIVALPMAFIGILLSLAWAGFRAVKGPGMDLTGAALSGSAAGLGSVIVLSLALIVMSVMNLFKLSESKEGTELIVIISTIVFSLAILIPFAAIASIIVGAIMGFLGAIAAQRKK
jgi:hypothetical protein